MIFFHIGEEFSAFDLLPVGNFVMLEGNNKRSFLESGTTSSQVQLLVLKNPIERIKTLSDILRGHSLEDYYYSILLHSNMIINFRNTGKSMEVEDILKPSVNGVAKVYISKSGEKMWRCNLVINGNLIVLVYHTNFFLTRTEDILKYSISGSFLNSAILHSAILKSAKVANKQQIHIVKMRI